MEPRLGQRRPLSLFTSWNLCPPPPHGQQDWPLRRKGSARGTRPALGAAGGLLGSDRRCRSETGQACSDMQASGRPEAAEKMGRPWRGDRAPLWDLMPSSLCLPRRERPLSTFLLLCLFFSPFHFPLFLCRSHISLRVKAKGLARPASP